MAVPVDVKDPENPFQRLLRSAVGHDVENQLIKVNIVYVLRELQCYHELNKVDVAILVLVIASEDVLLHTGRILSGQSLNMDR